MCARISPDKCFVEVVIKVHDHKDLEKYCRVKGMDNMAERNHRAVRMGIDVGGTYTKCVAMDNESHEIIGKNQVKTTHDDKSGVAAGVVKSFQNCMRENNIAPEDVVFVAHSTTQATNAFIEGDVASVGVVGVAGGGLEGFLAKRQLALKDIVLDEKVGRMIKVYNTFIKKKMLTEDVINQNIDELLNQGAQVIVASMAFGVDSMDEEMMIHGCAEKKNVPVTMASDITKLYGLTRRTRTASDQCIHPAKDDDDSQCNRVICTCGRRYRASDDHERRRWRYGDQ